MSKQKLELTWIGKEKRPKLEPRILLEDPEQSDLAIPCNRLTFGDSQNLSENVGANLFAQRRHALC